MDNLSLIQAFMKQDLAQHEVLENETYKAYRSLCQYKVNSDFVLKEKNSGKVVAVIHKQNEARNNELWVNGTTYTFKVVNGVIINFGNALYEARAELQQVAKTYNMTIQSMCYEWFFDHYNR